MQHQHVILASREFQDGRKRRYVDMSLCGVTFQKCVHMCSCCFTTQIFCDYSYCSCLFVAASARWSISRKAVDDRTRPRRSIRGRAVSWRRNNSLVQNTIFIASSSFVSRNPQLVQRRAISGTSCCSIQLLYHQLFPQQNTECTVVSDSSMMGICFTRSECEDKGGSADGNCAAGKNLLFRNAGRKTRS